MFFCDSRRGDVKKKFPDLKMTDVSKNLAEQWRAVEDGDKKEFEEKAEADKKRYQKEKKEYDEKQEAEKKEKGSEEEEEEEASDEE